MGAPTPVATPMKMYHRWLFSVLWSQRIFGNLMQRDQNCTGSTTNTVWQREHMGWISELNRTFRQRSSHCIHVTISTASQNFYTSIAPLIIRPASVTGRESYRVPGRWSPTMGLQNVWCNRFLKDDGLAILPLLILAQILETQISYKRFAKALQYFDVMIL